MDTLRIGTPLKFFHEGFMGYRSYIRGFATITLVWIISDSQTLQIHDALCPFDVSLFESCGLT